MNKSNIISNYSFPNEKIYKEQKYEHLDNNYLEPKLNKKRTNLGYKSADEIPQKRK